MSAALVLVHLGGDGMGAGAAYRTQGPDKFSLPLGIRFSLGAGWWTGKVPRVLTCAYKYLQIEFAK